MNTCDQFRVGTRAWTDCIHDAATGGGLMPWIVVVPLAVMVVGMAIGFARQFSSAGRRRAQAHGAAGTAGTWLIFVAFIELSIGIGSYVGAQRAGGGGGYAISATVLLGVGVVLLVIGILAKVRGRRRARIYHSGVPGEALIRDVRETGIMVNNQPMYEFDLDVEGSAFAPTSTTHREVVPLWMSGRVSPQTKIPVKVDPSNPARLIFDWDQVRNLASSVGPTPAGGAGVPQGGAPAAVDGRDLAAAMQSARQLAGGSGWHAGKIVGGLVLLLVLGIVGGALYFFASVFGTVSDATGDVTEQVNEALEEAGGFPTGLRPGRGGGTTLEISRAASGREQVGYSVELPLAWNDVTGAFPEKQGSVLVDVVMKPPPPSDARIVIARSVFYLQNPAPKGADIGDVRRRIEGELGDSMVRSEAVRLSGERAVAMELAPGSGGLRTRQIAVVREGQVLFVALTAHESEWRAMLPVFEDVLASWQWSVVSAR
jgi:hypothetical protein